MRRRIGGCVLFLEAAGAPLIRGYFVCDGFGRTQSHSDDVFLLGAAFVGAVVLTADVWLACMFRGIVWVERFFHCLGHDGVLEQPTAILRARVV